MMITKNDWDAALDAWVAEERERLGGPPSRDELAAYLSGELPPAEEARVRALLVYYPGLTPLLRTRRATRRLSALRLYAVAVTLVIALLSTDAIVQRRRSVQPSVPSSHHELNAVLTRGGAPAYELPAGQARYLLTIVPPEPPAESAYELEIVQESRVLWRARGVRPIDDTFVIDVPGAFLEPGTYTLLVRADGRFVARYTFRVTP
jgi:hypothetical protein